MWAKWGVEKDYKKNGKKKKKPKTNKQKTRVTNGKTLKSYCCHDKTNNIYFPTVRNRFNKLRHIQCLSYPH
jgi:hypothetical protein